MMNKISQNKCFQICYNESHLTSVDMRWPLSLLNMDFWIWIKKKKLFLTCCCCCKWSCLVQCCNKSSYWLGLESHFCKTWLESGARSGALINLTRVGTQTDLTWLWTRPMLTWLWIALCNWSAQSFLPESCPETWVRNKELRDCAPTK